MKVIVSPERDQEIVTQVVDDVISDRHLGGTANLTLTVMRQMMPPDWSVRASGLGDPILEASYADVVRSALKSALP
jgi:hypothetical protein